MRAHDVVTRSATGRAAPYAASWLTAVVLAGCAGGSEAPARPDPSASARASSWTGGSAVEQPSASPTRTPSTRGWSGAVRRGQKSLPVLAAGTGRVDGADATVGWIDIRRVSATTRPEWRLVLREQPPLASTLEPAGHVMEHGVVVDRDGDRVADCHVAISTDAPTPGDFRVWVTDLRAGITDEQVGPPYGFPIDFFHPAESDEPVEPKDRTIALFFLGGGAAARCGQGNYYAYAVLMGRGQDPEWDFAPDAAWLKVR